MYFLTITYPSTRISFNLEHLQADVRVVEIWHQHLDFMRTMLSEKQRLFLIGFLRKPDDPTEVWMCNVNFANQLNSVVASSLTWSHMVERRTKKVYFQSRKSVRFVAEFKKRKQKQTHQKSDKGIQSYEMQQKYPFNWEISLVHYKRGYSGPGHTGGVCSSVAYVMAGGSLNSHCLPRHVQMFVHEYSKKIF